MKSKQEVIQEAYDNTFTDSSNYSFEKIRSAVDENGWYRFNNNLTVNICTTGFDYDKGAYRPQSLRGIEHNNGWTRIESEADLLNIIGKYEHVFLMGIDGEIGIGFTIVLNDKVSRKYWLENATHYQPIIKPQAPIY